ncbi:hypothetical protein QE152_g10154 [Popillia japonica]|uniref:Uncharacterized protein n=1 Tax=Popillia japonica TaxID=7064 RepID=A0AAW1LVM3_POPJA
MRANKYDFGDGPTRRRENRRRPFGMQNNDEEYCPNYRKIKKETNFRAQQNKAPQMEKKKTEKNENDSNLLSKRV